MEAEIITEDILALARELAETRSQKELVEKELDRLNEIILGSESAPGIEPRLAKLMTDAGLQRFSLDGQTFFTAVSSYPKIVDEFGFFEFLAARGMDDIIKRTIHPQTLKAWFKEHPELEEELVSMRPNPTNLEHGEGIPGMLSVYAKINVRVRRDNKS